ncbi:MAG: hypothetical protein M3552_08195 [Planctomycetota bacterium]|nr:hypothetical protein [Planctomycetaceae bacterium]MDQ3330619.1 hypothetical protein [Planctomycetota bacterium]
MRDFVLTEESAKTPIGELLGGEDRSISIRDESGAIIARITPEEPEEEAVFSDEELAIIQRRRRSDPARDLTTDQLNDCLRTLQSERRS